MTEEDDTERLQAWFASRSEEPTSLAQMYEQASPLERLDLLRRLAELPEIKYGREGL